MANHVHRGPDLEKEYNVPRVQETQNIDGFVWLGFFLSLI